MRWYLGLCILTVGLVSGCQRSVVIPETDFPRTCSDGEIPKYDAQLGQWACGQDANDVPSNTGGGEVPSACDDGQVAKYNSAAGTWECAAVLTAGGELPVQCADGEVVKYNSDTGAWTCRPVVSAGAGIAVSDAGEISVSANPCDVEEALTVDAQGALSCQAVKSALAAGVGCAAGQVLEMDAQQNIACGDSHFNAQGGLELGSLTVAANETIENDPYLDIDLDGTEGAEARIGARELLLPQVTDDQGSVTVPALRVAAGAMEDYVGVNLHTDLVEQEAALRIAIGDGNIQQEFLSISNSAGVALTVPDNARALKINGTGICVVVMGNQCPLPYASMGSLLNEQVSVCCPVDLP